MCLSIEWKYYTHVELYACRIIRSYLRSLVEVACSETDFSMMILILSSISAEYADKRWIKITRIGELRQ